MRLRRVSVIAALSLLTWTATASAECAWVLWEDTVASNKIVTEPVRAYTFKKDCDQGLTAALTAASAPAPGVTVTSRGPEYQEVCVNVGRSSTCYRYVCLPDTVDPRGPKAK